LAFKKRKDRTVKTLEHAHDLASNIGVQIKTSRSPLRYYIVNRQPVYLLDTAVSDRGLMDCLHDLLDNADIDTPEGCDDHPCGSASCDYCADIAEDLASEYDPDEEGGAF
jgi:hypothetical protein